MVSSILHHNVTMEAKYRQKAFTFLSHFGLDIQPMKRFVPLKGKNIAVQGGLLLAVY